MDKLTKRMLDAVEVGDKESFLWDGELKGFGVRVSTEGRKTFVVQYRQGGRTRRMKLGTFGNITVDEARDIAKKALGRIADGEDPSAERRQERLAPNMAALCDRFLKEYVAYRCKPTTQGEYRRCCEIFIKPELGNMRVQDIMRPDVSKLHHKLRDKPYQANRVLGVLSKMFNLAEQWGLRPDGSNPTRHVERYAEQKRERFLYPEEIDQLWKVLEAAEQEKSISKHVAAAYKLLLLTGCRLREIQTLKWSYIRGDVIFLPDAKTGPRRVLLSKAALDVLADLPREPDNEFVIVGEVKGQHITDLQRPWRRLRAAAGIEDVRIHDLRHTYASIAAMAGHSLPMIGRLLGHTQAQSTQRYAHLADTTTRRALDQVDELIAGFVKTAPPSIEAAE